MMFVSCDRDTLQLINMSTSVFSSSWIISPVQGESFRSRLNRIHSIGALDASFFSARERFYGSKIGAKNGAGSIGLCRAFPRGDASSSDEDGEPQNQDGEGIIDSFREGLERMVGADDSNFTGLDLAALIKNKYGRSYDVQLIKKEFMGRNYLAMNVMWKYREQRSFPLTEEEYILRLDDVANNLRCWGAISHIRNSLAKLKERPRIGKAVSIFIDMDETGGRSREWIYK